jgi:hypothetical protein
VGEAARERKPFGKNLEGLPDGEGMGAGHERIIT